MEVISIIIALILITVILIPKKKAPAPKPKQQEIVLTDEFKEVLDILENSEASVFLTGKAGTGKSTLLKYFLKKTRKKYVVLAPTGIAALNIGGQTIHSFFRFAPEFIDTEKITPDYVRAELFQKLQVLVIDEVSMVRVDLMDGIDIALRKNRNRLNEPFGGVQMLFVGDLFQLPPVILPADKVRIDAKYGGGYFFDAPVFNDFPMQFKSLSKIFRQNEEEEAFKNMLNKIRINKAGYDEMVLLNSRHKDNAGPQNDSIFLTSKRLIARNINTQKLANLPGEIKEYKGILTGKYKNLSADDEDKLEEKLPAPYRLFLKKGAQIMMLKNDPGRRWVNGSIGTISKLEDGITVNIGGVEHQIELEVWKEVKYVFNPKTEEIEEQEIGSFSQYPIRLSWAITIHKSQGKTFDKITIDVGAGAFAHGQVYVALSRCKSLDGIVLNNPIQNKDIIVDQRVVDFYQRFGEFG